MQTEDFDLVQPVDEQMDDYERRRLLYVAATRARDHLVVSLHRSGSRRHSSNAELIASRAHRSDRRRPVCRRTSFNGPAVIASSAGSRSAEVAPPVNRAGVEATGSPTPAKPAASARPRAPPASKAPARTSPSKTQTHGAAKAARDVELPPWSKGRYGTAIGRAVHGVLQVVDLATGAGLEPPSRRSALPRASSSTPMS